MTDIVKAMTLFLSPWLLAISAIMAQPAVAVPRGLVAASKLPISSRSSSTNNTLLNTPITKIDLPDSVLNLTDTVGTPDFPPGPQPPRDFWPVHLRYTDDDVWVVFHFYNYVEPSNDTQVGQALQQAILESSDPHRRSQFMEPREYVWSQAWERTVVAVKVEVDNTQPSELPPHPEIGLTFGVWTSCLIAINRFRLAYPGVYPQFNIFIRPEGALSYNVGRGRLQVRQQQWQPLPGVAPAPSDATAVTKRSPLDPVMLNDALPNNSATGTNLTGAVSASDLPPGSQPPVDPWFYGIRFSHPITTLKFMDHEHVDGRNETQVEDLIRQAISASTEPQDQPMDQRPYTWSGTQTLLGVEPLRAHELVELTYGIWLFCLVGINQFRLAYPGLYFVFEIYVQINEEEELYLGRGALLRVPSLQAPAATVDDVAVTKRSPLYQSGGQYNTLPKNSIRGVNLTGELGASTFPPGPQPPTDPWTYDVRFSNPSIQLKFLQFRLDHSRDETDVTKIIQRAVLFAISDPEQRDQFLKRHQYTWFSDDGRISLGVLPYTPQPSTDPPHAMVGLTYKMWEYSLIGINQFRLAYPGLNFRFEVYITGCIGAGSLESGPLIQRPDTPGDDTVQVS